MNVKRFLHVVAIGFSSLVSMASHGHAKAEITKKAKKETSLSKSHKHAGTAAYSTGGAQDPPPKPDPMLMAMAGTADESPVVSCLQLLAGAAFLGAVMDGLLLGHWYLTDRGLSRGPINRSTSFLIVAVLLEAAAVVAGGFGPPGRRRTSTRCSPRPGSRRGSRSGWSAPLRSSPC